MKVRLLILIFLVALATLGLIFSLPDVTSYSNCTDSYKIYKEVEKYSTISSLTDYLKDNKIEYSIEDNQLKLTKYGDISFKVVNDEDCNVVKSNLMNSLKKLDEKDYNVITVKGQIDSKSGNIVEKISYSTFSQKVYKTDDSYYCVHDLLAHSLVLLVSISLYTIVIVFFIGGKRKKSPPDCDVIEF